MEGRNVGTPMSASMAPAGARELLENMLGHLGFAFTLEEEKRGDDVVLHVRMQNPSRLIGREGETIDDLQFLLNRMLAEYPDHLGTYTEGAEVLLLEGRIVEAIKWIERGFARFPENPVLLNNRGLCHLLNADLPAAMTDFQKAYDADPADADYVGNLALAKALAGDETEARRLWSRVLGPEDVARNLAQANDARPKFKSPK